MIKEEFLSAYAKASEMPVAELKQRYTAVPCGCGGADCDGWMILNKDDIKVQTAGAGNFDNSVLDIGFRKQGAFK